MSYNWQSVLEKDRISIGREEQDITFQVTSHTKLYATLVNYTLFASNRQVDRQRQTDGRMDGWTDRRTDEQTDRQTDTQTDLCRVLMAFPWSKSV